MLSIPTAEEALKKVYETDITFFEQQKREEVAQAINEAIYIKRKRYCYISDTLPEVLVDFLTSQGYKVEPRSRYLETTTLISW